MEELKEKLPDDVVLKGDMTTNGYLLNKINFKRLIDVNINHYQITVDGLKESHDSTRILANGNGTWDTIITNLLNMKNTDYTFTVTLRSNISKFYIEDIDEWCKFVFEKFGDDTRFITHMETVKNLGGDAAEFLFDHDNDPSDKIIFAQKNNKLNISETIYRDNFSMTCYASKNNNLCIYHNGNIVKCTVDFDDLDINIVGNILPNGEYSLKEENLSWWTNYELFDTCKECEIYPVCYGKKCPRSYFNPEACDIQKKIYYSSVVCV